MDKIRNMPLRKYFFLIMVLYLSSALLLSVLSYRLCDLVIDELGLYKVLSTEEFMALDEDEFRRQNDPSHDSPPIVLQYFDDSVEKYYYYTVEPWYGILKFLQRALPTLLIIAALLLSDLTFYRRKLREPIAILSESTDRIRNHDLDFRIPGSSSDELGELCSAFETMRQALSDNYDEMWRQIEERKRLNSAFAHDLRTPLTVLKGQSDMLLRYAYKLPPEKVAETANTMKRQALRMESYVESMSKLHRIEDIEICKSLVGIDEIIKQLKLIGTSVCDGISFTLSLNEGDHLSPANEIKIDLSALMEVCENLLANAARHASSMVTLSIDIIENEHEDNELIISIADDGTGFTAEALANAHKPFYSGDNSIDAARSEGHSDSDNHSGLGLYISKLICEKHGGYLKFHNDNGAVATASFRI